MMAVSYIIINVIVGVAGSLNIALLNKSISSVTLSRGAFLGTAALSSLVGILYIDVISAQTYPHNKKSPFQICVWTEVFTLLVILVLAICRQLHV